MAKFCTNCGHENVETDRFCTSCGAEFSVDTADFSYTKAPIVKQAQNSAIRNILVAVIIASVLLCFITCIQYISGSILILETTSYSERYDDTETIRTLTEANTWEMLGEFFEDLDDFEFEGKQTITQILMILSPGINALIYFLLIIVFGITLFLILSKNSKASLFTIISGCFALLIIFTGFIFSYFIMSYSIENGFNSYSVHTLPPLTLLPMLPLLLQMPFVAFMLPKKHSNNEDK